ncbi:formin-like protein 13 [Scleropages formosus]|uniref:Formin-like protein 13 n=1 Tax=Scleropages formosus TaxID=113540 RepID=A0A8C9TD90_SCLFO|nr:formin-like protein 13 [Scleropages formosus]
MTTTTTMMMMSAPAEHKRTVPQLSNELQLRIMHKVKNGELSIEDALKEAREETCRSAADVDSTSQYNFSVYKFNRYRWQKRVLQIDFKTRVLCSIEKGIVKRQIPFHVVKSCEDGVAAKFCISFRERHDYELEATSLEDKHKIIQLVNKIIHGNIYTSPGRVDAETRDQPLQPNCLREGQLYLQRGGLASIRWVKYTVRLHEGQLSLLPVTVNVGGVGICTAPQTQTTVIHFSDGNASVEKPRSCDTFTLITKINEYLFRVPVSAQTNSTEAIAAERDEWVRAIDELCLVWKHRLQAENQSLYEIIPEPGGTNKSGEVGKRSPSPQAQEAQLASSPDEDRDRAIPPVPTARSPPPAYLSPKPCDHPKSALLVPVFPGLPLPIAPPVPAPPPLPSRLNVTPTSRKTKAFHWDVVAHDKVGKSLWAQRDASTVRIDTARLYEQFGIQDSACPGSVDPLNNQHIMLNQKVAHNFNIFLRSFPVKPEELKDRLFIVNEEDGALSDEHITSLRRYVPTSDDVEMYKSYKGSPSELHLVDQYMLEMCNIPYLSTQLDLLLTLRELPVSMEDLQPLISQKIRMCSQLYGSKSFVAILEYLLAVGNYLNENSGKEKAKGFRLSSLAKLSQLRGKDRKFTLLHALVEQVRLHDPHVATFFQELAEFETVPGASVKGLTAEVDVLKNELQKVIQYRKTYKRKNQGAQHQKFLRDLKVAIERHNSDLSQMTKRCEDMKKLYSDILVKFGEPLEQDSQELFGWVSTFINDFKRVHAEMTQ